MPHCSESIPLITDLNGQVNIIGDGINVAQRVMSFCPAGELLVSRSFYEIAANLSEAHAAMFKQAGEHKDKHARAHESCSVVRNAPAKAGAVAPVVAGKLKKLLDDGATVVSEAESINGVWTAVCEERVDWSRFQRGK